MKKWCGDVRACQTRGGIVPVIVPDGGFGQHGYEGLYGFAHGVSDTVWGDCITMVPWAVYRTSGDPEILEENYEGMKAWLGYERKQAAKPFSHGYKKYIWTWGLHFGDWLAPGGSITENMKKAKWICTAYYANSARIVAASARILGKEKEAAQYRSLYEQIRGAFRKAFIGPDHHITAGFQTIYALALVFDLLDEEERRMAASDLNTDVIEHGYHLTTGFAGTAYILEALSANGYEDTAWKLLMQEECPGWLYLLFFAYKLREKFSLRQLFSFGFLIMAAGCLLMYFANANLVLIVVSMALRGVGALPFLCYAAPLTGYISDYALYKSGHHMDGIVYSGYSMGGKVGTGLGSALVGWIIGLCGYSGTAAVQTETAILSIRVVNSLVPMVFALLAALCFWQITVEDGIGEIQEKLKARGLRS